MTNARISLPKGAPRTAANGHPYGLTRRELEVIQTLAHCYTQREIAAELDFGIETARRHLYNAYQKTGAEDMQSLLLFAIRKRLLTIEAEEQP